MKKIILSLSFALLASIGFSVASFAQQPASNGDEVTSLKFEKNHKRNFKKECAGNRKCNVERVKFNNPFEGIELSESQKQQIKELNKSIKPECVSKKCEKIDSVDHKKDNEKGENCIKQRKENKKKMLEGLKSILTPEQYQQYLENSYLNSGKKSFNKPHFKKHGDKKMKPENKKE